MRRIKRTNYLLFGSLGLIIFGIIIASIIDKITTTNNNQSDIRARAGVIKNLTADATVISTDATQGTITVNDLYFTDNSRSGEAKNLGSWIVKAPSSFNLLSVSTGTNIEISVEASSFNVASHNLVATSITVK